MKPIINLYEQLLSFTLVINAKINNILYDLTLKRIKKEDKKIILEYFKANKEHYLQIGCGFNLLPNWLNSDMEPKNDHIIYLDANEKFTFKDNTFQFIFSEHLIEHLDFEGVINLLKESYRTLKIGGHIRIATPDLSFLNNLYQNPLNKDNKSYIQWALNQYLNNIATSHFTNLNINHIYVINNFHKAWGHQIIFTFDTLKFILESIGFKNVVKMDIGKSSHKELSGIERHSKIIPNQFNKMETMILEAEK